MPPAAWLSSERRAELTDAGRARLALVPEADATLEARVLRALASEGPIGPKDLAARVRSDTADRVVRSLQQDGLVRLSHALTGRPRRSAPSGTPLSQVHRVRGSFRSFRPPWQQVRRGLQVLRVRPVHPGHQVLQVWP